jgi:hypothetical protein
LGIFLSNLQQVQFKHYLEEFCADGGTLFRPATDGAADDDDDVDVAETGVAFFRLFENSLLNNAIFCVIFFSIETLNFVGGLVCITQSMFELFEQFHFALILLCSIRYPLPRNSLCENLYFIVIVYRL